MAKNYAHTTTNANTANHDNTTKIYVPDGAAYSASEIDQTSRDSKKLIV